MGKVTVSTIEHNGVQCKQLDNLLPETPRNCFSERQNIKKNILVIGFGFLCMFTAYNGLGRLQSSLHRDQGMGVICQSIQYTTFFFSALLLPDLIIHLVGHKWTMPLSFIGVLLWMAANGYAVWATMVPASILAGLSGAPLWTAKSAYITHAAVNYAKLTGETKSVVLARFNGLFGLIHNFSTIFGSIISSTVLNQTPVNGTWDVSNEALGYCGANDCPDIDKSNFTNPNLDKPSDKTIWTLVGIYFIVGLLGVIVMIMLVDELPNTTRHNWRSVRKDVSRYLTSSFRQMMLPVQWLICGEVIGSALRTHFLDVEFNKSYVSCSVGIWMVGWVTIPTGIFKVISSPTGGYLAKHIGRIPIVILGLTTAIGLLLTLRFWMPTPEEVYVLYIVSAFNGLISISVPCTNALYSTMFSTTPEPLFACNQAFGALTNAVVFGYSNFLCASTKLYIALFMQTIGLITYLVAEYSHAQSRKQANDTPEKDKIAEEYNTYL